MIFAETPVRELEGQIRGLQELLRQGQPLNKAMWILGAIAVLGWIKDGGESPVEQA